MPAGFVVLDSFVWRRDGGQRHDGCACRWGAPSVGLVLRPRAEAVQNQRGRRMDILWRTWGCVPHRETTRVC